MSSVVLSLQPSTASPASFFVALGSASNIVRRSAVNVMATATRSIVRAGGARATEAELATAFASWADESLEWAQATFEVQADTWPVR